MNRSLLLFAAVITALAVYLPTRVQSFTRVTVDGRTTRMLVAGGGATTVVFESGLAGPLEHWGKVQPAVSRFARTVSYDRANVGLSAAGPLPRDGRRIAAELHGVLRAAGIAPPFVLVGASLGGPFVRIFAGMYPDLIAGLVLVDPTPDSEQSDPSSGLPEMDAMPATLEQSRASRIPGGVPVFLIDSIYPREVPFATKAIRARRMSNRADLDAESVEYREWLNTIPHSRLIVTDRSGHNVAQEEPALVIVTIKQMVEELARRPRR